MRTVGCVNRQLEPLARSCLDDFRDFFRYSTPTKVMVNRAGFPAEFRAYYSSDVNLLVARIQTWSAREALRKWPLRVIRQCA